MSNEIEHHETESADAAPARGTPESAAWFRDQLAALGLGQMALARLLRQYGDDRLEASIRRTKARMANGQARVSGERLVLLTVLKSMPHLVQADTHEPASRSEAA